jgi:predicted GNAT family N-acyltransferase
MIDIDKVEQDSEGLQQAFAIRDEVFVAEQKVDREIEYEFEEESIHFLAKINEVPAGTARWRHTDKGIKLERFAVLAQFRHIGIASMLISSIIDDIGQEIESNRVYLHSQENVCDLYAKHGFKVEGARFWEANIPHFTMVLQKS